MPNNFNKTAYSLSSVHSGKQFDDSGWLLDAPDEDIAGLIRAIYQNKQLKPLGREYGIYTFANWLPVSRMLKGSFAPLTYKSSGFAKEVGLKNLYITFSGYWPEKGIEMKTCSFKETEAYSVCGRLDPQEEKILVVASAGNTARAFAQVCSDNQIPLLLCVPEDNLNALWFEKPLHHCVKLISSRSGGDYFDAIHLSNIAVQLPRFIPEGGAKNVARRDGMATTVLSAATHIGQIPDYYFQAVGSGTGAIAAWEANLRLLKDGRFGNKKMKLMVSQNKPFVPIYEAWQANSRALLPMDDFHARKQVEAIDAKVLSNRKPPYSLVGGLFDALTDTGGEVLLAGNEEAREAALLFEESEGIDIHPAAAIATASLINYLKDDQLDRNSIVMLNITGGGEERFKKSHDLFYLKPERVFDMNPNEDLVKRELEKLYV